MLAWLSSRCQGTGLPACLTSECAKINDIDDRKHW
jgi:hypothetical protein